MIELNDIAAIGVIAIINYDCIDPIDKIHYHHQLPDRFVDSAYNFNV